MRNKKSITRTRLIEPADTQHQLVITRETLAKVHGMSLSAIPFQIKLIVGRLSLLTLVGCTVILASLFFTTLPVAAQQNQIFVPFVSTPDDSVGGSGEETTECGLNVEEAAVAEFMLTEPGQKRDNPVCNAILSQVARARAQDMALRGYLSHTNPDGDGPNLLAREAGYQLPDWYASKQDSNNIESIAGGYSTPEDLWEGWINSHKHRVHVLGTESFYGDQDAYGVGYYFNPDSPMGHYWVFISAPVEE